MSILASSIGPDHVRWLHRPALHLPADSLAGLLQRDPQIMVTDELLYATWCEQAQLGTPSLWLTPPAGHDGSNIITITTPDEPDHVHPGPRPMCVQGRCWWRWTLSTNTQYRTKLVYLIGSYESITNTWRATWPD